ncbi:calcium-binding and coiled-coil domain-containing protein 1-like [Neoarius graeffei]|uniref:calcium-binding and coiled-coil domain-containing protein 1-like n=1 Tax=Neoarius graeffei TaxID=443677 RepID=UPI00298C9620|nr:calcium-binding and coiled-coil domain-containing protein 1-like [Neoarius graeffei]
MTLTDIKESLKGSLAEAERKNEQMMEFNVQLENEKSDLMHTVHELRGKVSQLMEMFCDIDMTCGTIKQDHEQMREAYRILKSQYEEVLKQQDASLMECAQEWEAQNILKLKCDQMKVSLAEAVKKYEQVMESNAQQKDENYDLMYQANTLQDSVQQLKMELSESCRKFDEVKRECEKELEVYHMLQSQNDELKMLLNHNEELVKITLAEAERKYKQVMESNAQPEKEKSELMYHLHRFSVAAGGNMIR